MNSGADKRGGLIGFFINNTVAANLLMLFIIILGVVSYQGINKQIFPTSELNFIEIEISYLGAAPKEVEESVVRKLEDELRHLPDIKHLSSWSRYGSGRLVMELRKGTDAAFALDKVNAIVDGIPSLPRDMDPMVVKLLENNQAVIRLALVGDGNNTLLKQYAQEVERELLDLKNVSVLQVKQPDNEIAIEIDPMALRMYSLTMDDIRQRLASYSQNISSGQIRGEAGVIALRVEQQAYDRAAFENIPLITAPSGIQVKLGDIAKVKDDFIEGVHFFTYSGEKATFIEVQATAKQDMSAVADSVRNYVAYKNDNLPKWMRLEIIIDGTSYLDQRLAMMEENLLQGAVLVLLMLTLFLSFKLAFWVVVGLPVCFLGAALIMPFFGVTINIISLFAFIMVLGLVVDDAIVVGESVYEQTEKNGLNNDSVEAGVRRVSKPAIFGVLTTIAVFVPFVFSDGAQADLFKGVATIVIFCLIFSIIESKLILPAHLAASKQKPAKTSGFKYQVNSRLKNFSHNRLPGAVAWAIERKWSVLLLFICTLGISASMIKFGHVNQIPDPKVPIDQPELSIELHDNVSENDVKRAVKELDGMVKAVEAQTVQQFGRGMIEEILIESVGQTEIKLTVPLVDESVRPYNTFELSRRWREAMPDIVALKAVHIKDDVLGQNNRYGDFGYFLYSDDIDELNDATKLMIAKLKQIPGVYEVSSTISAGKKEFIMELKPVAHILGLELADIGRQLSQGYFGAEVERFNRNGEEVRVLVRYGQDVRASISDLQYARIYTQNGDEVMLGDVVNLKEQESVTVIRRDSGKRSIYVFGSVDQSQVSIREVVMALRNDIMPELRSQNPSVSTQLGGKIKETIEEQDQMFIFTVAALLMVYILLAVPLKSYIQPLLIMSIIPFSVVGSIWGHWIFGEDFSLVSIFGLVAAAGVVVNDSLILVDRINQKMSQGLDTVKGVIEAVCERFRAIFLTSVTTFAGLLPIMFETNLQAKFVTPMAISLGFSVLFATCITLFLIPCLYVAGSRFKDFFGKRSLSLPKISLRKATAGQ